MIIRESVKMGDKTVTIETGRVAKQASGSVLISCGETVVLVTACGSEEARPGTSFLPLTVDYIEKTYAAGKIPGGFFKREGRLREAEILTCRLIDRPCRPLFPSGYRAEVQIVATVLSHDTENASDILALTGASAAIHLSQVPWAGPLAGVRIGRVDGAWVANPTTAELAESDCDIVMAASKDAIMMVEGECDELTEAEMIDGLMFGHEAVQAVIGLIEKLREAAGKEKWVFTPASRDEKIDARVQEVGLDRVKEACNVAEKHARYGQFKSVKRAVAAELAGEFPDNEGDIKAAFADLQYKTMRSQILDEGCRVDGRDRKTVRPITLEAGWLPRTHGSALFTRGETQAIVTTTLGTRQDEQRVDGLTEEYWKRFMLHYNFPPYSVGETKFMRGPGRREIGHGNLAERALKRAIPSSEDFPYTIRIVSETTESNGSSSMAAVCGGALALMDAGVPISGPVAGVAMGLVKEGDKYAILTDILGDEDHLGDMDFKVCGTDKGVTAIQMDIKISGLSREIMQEALTQAMEARLHILEKMNETLATPREELSLHAPRITAVKVKPDQIRLVIGPGGKMIKAIVDQTGCKIDVQDDGTVSVAGSDPESVKKALEIIESLTTEPEVGQVCTGIVRRVEAYGAFLEISPGHDGLCHISDFAWERVEKVEDIMKLGDEVEVKIINVDRDGKIKLSRKELLEKPEGWVEPPPRERRDSRGRDGGRDGGRASGRDDRSRSRDGGGNGGGGERRRTRGDGGERRERQNRPDAQRVEEKAAAPAAAAEKWDDFDDDWGPDDEANTSSTTTKDEAAPRRRSRRRRSTERAES